MYLLLSFHLTRRATRASGHDENVPLSQAEVARAESIILTYAVDSPQSVLALRDEWLPELRRFGVRVRAEPPTPSCMQRGQVYLIIPACALPRLRGGRVV